ncbi:hypothetical protein [Halorhabdus rudnickae]|uniref:hypothetical protein n=1 Tax=Halorhabdus rudnickae TaxID=1775544 RepID=UPI001082E56F|nr:hypothetical protein [Halorhabdus rudnickae]
MEPSTFFSIEGGEEPVVWQGSVFDESLGHHTDELLFSNPEAALNHAVGALSKYGFNATIEDFERQNERLWEASFEGVKGQVLCPKVFDSAQQATEE